MTEDRDQKSEGLPEAYIDCALQQNGQCGKAGTPECEACPNSHGEFFAGSNEWLKKHNDRLPVDGCQCSNCLTAALTAVPGSGQGWDALVLAEYRRRDFVAFQWDGEKTDIFTQLVTTLRLRQMVDEGLAPDDMIVISSEAPHHPKFYKPHVFRQFFEPVQSITGVVEEVRVAPKYVGLEARCLADALGEINAASETRDIAYQADNLLVQFFFEVGCGNVARVYRVLKGMES